MSDTGPILPIQTGLPGRPAIQAPDPNAINRVLMAGTSVIAQAMQKAIVPIATGIKAADDVAQSAAAKAATSVTNGINTAQATVDQAQTTAQTSLAGQIASSTPTIAGGGTAEQGASPDQFAYNVWQKCAGGAWQPPIVASRGDPTYSTSNSCFRGSWENFVDADHAAATLALVPGTYCAPDLFCASGSNDGTVLQSGCTSWAVWVFPAGQSSLCSYPYCDGSIPDPSGAGGHKMLFSTQAEAAAFAASQTCASPAPPTPDVTLPLPTGLSPQYGQGPVTSLPPSTPYPTYAGAPGITVGGLPSNVGGGTQGPGTGNGTGSTQPPACCPVPPFPDCVKVDLCASDQLIAAITEGIFQGVCRVLQDPDCLCKLRDSDRYIIEDCGGEVATQVDDWKGQIGSAITDQSVDGLVDSALAAANPLALGVEDTGPDPWR